MSLFIVGAVTLLGVRVPAMATVTRFVVHPIALAVPSKPDPAITRPHLIRSTFFDNGMRPLVVNDSTTSIRSWGIISAPTDGSGPFPLAIVLHGAHSFCSTGPSRSWPCPDRSEVANHDGLSWLTEALARRGFVAIAIGINAEYAHPTNKVAALSASIIERDVLAPLSDTNGRFAAWLDPRIVDLSTVILVGHSRGAAVAAVLGRRDEGRALRVPVAATILLAPTSDTVSPALVADVPTAVFIGSCDGDTGVDGGQFFTASMSRVRRTPLALVLLRGATHNATNDRLPPESSERANPDCADNIRLDPEAQRSRLAELVPNFIRGLRGYSGSSNGQTIDVRRADDRIAPGIRLVHLDPTSRRRTILDPAYGWPFRGAMATQLRVDRCPGGMSSPFRAPGTQQCHRFELTELVGRPASTRFAWTTAGATLRLSHQRLSAGTVLVIRAFADPLSFKPGAEVTATLTGTSSESPQQVWLMRLRFPVDAVGEPITDSGLRRGAVLWSERRIVIPSATGSTTLTINGPTSGALDIVGIEAVITTP